MGLSSSSQKQTQQSSGTSNNNTSNTYDYMPGAQSADIDALRNRKFEVDPGLAAQYGRQRADLNKSFAQPLGGYLSPQVRDAQMRSGQERLGRDEAEALRGGQFDKNKLEYSRDAAVAGMTAPQLVQRSSTSSGSSTGNSSGQMAQTPSAMSTVTGVGAALAPLSL